MSLKLTDRLVKFITAATPGYLPTRLHCFLCDLIQEEVTRGGARLCISIPPRHGKSEIVSKGLPPWYFGLNPSAEVMEICHSADLAGEFGTDVRALMSSPFYAKLFPDSIASGDGRAGAKWRTVSGGRYKGEGIDGSFTGFGAHLLLVDDLVKNRKVAHSPTFQKQTRDTFGSTIFTRLLPDSNIIILNTRWTANDIIAYCANELGWRYINLPAIALENDPMGREPGEALCPERYPLEALLEIKRTMSPYDWEALYQGMPPDEVRVTDFNRTPPDVKPLMGVWFDDRVLLFNEEACTAMGTAETLSELREYLDSKEASKLTIYHPDNAVVKHPHTPNIIPRLRYYPQLEGYTPAINMTFPPGPVSPRDIGAARYYMTAPRAASGGFKGVLTLR